MEFKVLDYICKMRETKTFLVVLLLIGLSLSADYQHPTSPQDQIVMAVGQIVPGSIDVAVSKQQIHLLRLEHVQRKYLFIRASTFDKVRMSIGIYYNQSRQLAYACEDINFDSCYVPSSFVKANTTYAVLIVANDNMKYNLYAYWGDLQHIKPNEKVKFMFDKTDPNQLFHLQFSQQTKYEQIRIVLKPEASRSQGDNVRIFANIGFKQQPTIERHDYVSNHVWGDAQAIILSKQDLKGETGIALYVLGNAQTVYTLQCEFVQQTSHVLKLQQTLFQYLPKGQQTYYQMNFKDNGNVDSFVIKFSVFTGEVEVGFYYDRQFKNAYQKLPYQYMSDMQFNFDKKDFQNNTKQIYMKVRCPDAPGTYQISTQSRQKQIAFEITENVYQFSALSEPREAMYFYSHIWDESQYEKYKSYKFDVSVIKIFGNPHIQFYMCRPQANEQDCKKINNNQYFQKFVTKLKPVGVQQIGSKIINTLQFNESVYKNLNAVQKRLMVMIIVSNLQGASSAYAVQYSNPNKVRLLRQGRAFEDKVKLQEKKYYKFINNNPTATEIRIHINEISGLTKIRAKRSNIFQKGGEQITIQKQLPDTIVIKDKITDPIYIEVHGLVTSLYTISVSTIHSEHIISNALVMAEDVEYEVKLLPYQHMNIQLHPIQSDIVFDFYSEGGAVVVCEVDYSDACIGDKLGGSHGSININAASKREIRIRIGNFIDANALTPKTADTNDSKSATGLDKKLQLIRKVKLTLIYHAGGMDHCDERRMNKVYSENVKSGACFKYHLPLASDIEIMSSRSDLSDTFQTYFICSKKVVPAQVNNRYVIKSNVIQQSCKELPNDMILMIVVGQIDQTQADRKNQIKMEYSVQYNNDTITLADGVAYVARGYSNGEAPLRTFFYEILDQDRQVNIVLNNKKGTQKFYANIVPKPERYSGIVSEGSAAFSSRNSNYYVNPYIQIKPQDIEKAQCGRTCVMILTLYSSQKAGAQIQYSLEVTQNHIYLKQNQIRKSYLSKGSFDYFEYQCKSATGSLIFKVSDNNRKCARAIMSRNPFPSGSNYFVKENQGTIVYEKSNKGTVYFAVEAIEDCPYSVSVSQETVLITKIEHGQFYDIKLQQGQQKWFYHRHNSKNSFKIISLKKHGEINIFANQTDLNKNMLEELRNNKINSENFSFKSWYKNTLVINSTNKQFCHGCYYLICIKATKLTEASIMIGSDNTKITLSQNKILFDQIDNKDGVTYASFYKVSDGQLQVKVHSGKVSFEMSYGNQKFTKSFNVNKKVYHEKYNFTREQFTFKPIQIKVVAEQAPALYSFELTPNVNSAILNHKVHPGEHSYIFLSRGQTQCLTGTLTSKEQELYISVDTSQKLALSSLNMTVKLDGKETDKYTTQLVGNIMSIKFVSQSQFFTTAQNYSICLKTAAVNDTLSLFAFQNQNINLIHSDTEVLVRKQNKFVLYPNTDIILDLFECRGTAEIYYGSNLQTIRKKESHKLDVIGIPGQSHAIKIQSFSALYIDVIAQMATILWMPINAKEERGVGYFKYAIGGLQYSSKFNMIQFKIGGVYKSKTTETKPKMVKYTLFISNSKDQLQEAVMCEKQRKNKFVSASIATESVGNLTSEPIYISIDKKHITDQFSTNETLYFNVVADMTLQAPNTQGEQDHEHYKFIYFEQVVPSEVFRQNKIQSMQLVLLIALAVVSLIGFVLISCIFVRCIVPAIGRLKNRVLVEEKEDPKDQSIPIPPSSDRNQIPTVPGGTDEQLAK